LKSLFEFVDSVRSCPPSIEEVTEFTRALAFSGDVLRPDSVRTADISSTGGPSSLSTLLCPLQLVALGWQVPKLAVTGRPAGGIDVMAQIPGYCMGVAGAEVLAILAECGYANCEAGDQFAPADAATFKYRQEIGLQANGALAVASLVAKKAAMGIVRAGLDVRVAPYGNFGPDLARAAANAKLFVWVARELGIEATCYLNDATQPFQPYIGRAEALIALSELFEGHANAWLKRHADLCLAMSLDLVESPPESAPTEVSLKEIFRKHVAAHRGTIDGFERTVDRAREAHTFEIHADREGFISYDLAAIRSTLMAAQRHRDYAFSDPAGLILKAEPDAFVKRGSLLMTARIDDDLVHAVYPLLAGCVSYNRISSRIAEVVRG
jgi:thymidine phosphorylase